MNISVSEPPQIYETADDIFRDRDSGRHYPYGIKLMKLISAMRGKTVSGYQSVAYEMPFPFHRESDFFQLNLHPIAFRKVDSHLWVDKYKAATGLSTRDEYLENFADEIASLKSDLGWNAVDRSLSLVLGVHSKMTLEPHLDFTAARTRRTLKGARLRGCQTVAPF